VHTSRSRSISRSQPARVLLAAAVLLGLIAALIASGHGSAATMNPQIKVSTTKYGKILVDAKGRTLYMLTADKHGKSACYGQCATFWPPMIASNSHITATGLKASLLRTTTRSDGKLQVSYNSHPLYRFLKDTKAGQTNGQGLNAFGGMWWVLSPAGTPIKQTAPAGGGYGT
jgi:predicted lipoprotein with Yx(FWY)xxD motif